MARPELSDKDASEKASVSRNAAGIVLRANAVLLSAGDRDVLLYIVSPAASTRRQKQITIFSGRALYLYAAVLVQELRSVQSLARRKYLLSLGNFPLIETSQTKVFSLPVRKTYLSTMRLSSYDPTDKTGALAAGAQGRAQRIIRALKKQFSLGEGVVPSAWAAEKSLRPSTLRDFHRLEKRAGARDIQFEFKPALRMLRTKKDAPASFMKPTKVMTSVLGSGIARERE